MALSRPPPLAVPVCTACILVFSCACGVAGESPCGVCPSLPLPPPSFIRRRLNIQPCNCVVPLHIRMFECVYCACVCLQGSPFDGADLLRAGVHVAASAVIFKQKIESASDESLVDADTLCIYRCVGCFFCRAGSDDLQLHPRVFFFFSLYIGLIP